MGCGSSKTVQVDAAPTQQTTKPQEATTDEIESDSPRRCINRENGEVITKSECLRERGEINATDTRISRQSLDSADEADESIQSNTQTQKILQETDKNNLETESEISLDRLNFTLLFVIIRNRVYEDDLRQLIDLKTEIADLKYQVYDATISNSHAEFPPINDEEAKLDNPRRKLPPRNLLREKTGIVAMEVDIAFRILATGQYVADSDEVEKLKLEVNELKDRLKSLEETQ